MKSNNKVELRDFLWSIRIRSLKVSECTNMNGDFIAEIVGYEIRDQGILTSVVGFGNRKDKALKALAKNISNKLLCRLNEPPIIVVPPLKCTVPWSNKKYWEPVVK